MPLTDRDLAAKSLYEVSGHHVAPCSGPLTLYDRLTGVCPHCGAVIVAGPDITPERAAEMLRELQWRRWVLGLKP